MRAHDAPAANPPARFDRPSLPAFLAWVAAAALVTSAFRGAGVSIGELANGLPSFARIVSEMFPPSTARLGAVLAALWQTFEMAVAGTVLGIALSAPLALLAARNLTPHRILYHASRGLVGFCRTVPDLVWALMFVATVGLGPFAGVLAIAVDKIGFCGRFFAEAAEEADPGPQEALRAMGASRSAIVAGAILPCCAPSFVATALFALEKATRSSVILGLVGAGGIGIELQVSMEMFRYDEAATIIIVILLLVLAVEHCSSIIRRRLI